MAGPNPLNVYAGHDSLRKYYDPERQPLLPLVEVPQCLNPLYNDGVRIYAKMMNALPAHNVKALPALNMLQSEQITEKTKTVIESSSGSTVISMAIIARVLHAIDDTRALITNKTSEAKLKMMRFFGLNLILFGGPSQAEPTDPRGPIQMAQEVAKSSETIEHPNQYINDLNPDAHYRWTGPQLIKQLPEMNVFAAGMGTAGTMVGTGSFLKKAKQSITRVGIFTEPADSVPGPRPRALVANAEFPWLESIDAVEEVGSFDSYRLSLALSREGLICGPSSGFNLQGLHQFLEKRQEQGTLQDLAEEGGRIHCVFICCDLPYQYLDDYFSKLGQDHFSPIVNDNLLKVDRYRYDPAWELCRDDAFERLYDGKSADATAPGLKKPNTVLLDLRSSADFDAWHLQDAINMPAQSISADSQSPFANPKLLEEQWLELAKCFDEDTSSSSHLILSSLRQHLVVVVCYKGDTSFVATSILRARKVGAFSLKGGIRSIVSS